MLNTDHTTHKTAFTHIVGEDGAGWDFHCTECNFRMRYYIPECSQEAQLEVISLGDVEARHLTDFSPLERSRGPALEEWLTSDIRQTIEKIFKKFGK